MTSTFLFRALAALLALAAPVGAARAAASDWAAWPEAEARLVTAVDATGELDAIPAGLHVRLAPGWKTYWRSPGDAGLPPQLDWSGSDNLAGADLAFPAPRRFTLFGLETFGYGDEVVFPLTLRPAQPGLPVELRATADLLVCAEICIPHRFDLALTLPSGPAAPAPEAFLIDQWESRVPDDGTASGLMVERVETRGGALVVEAVAREPFEAPDVLVEAAGLGFGAPDIRLSEGGRRLRATLEPAGEGGADLAGTGLTVTLVDGDRAAEHAAVVATAAPVAGAWFGMLGVALLGGLILNLMPCVLPVLSLKLVGAVRLGAAATGQVRAGFLATAAGIVFSFLVLAGGLVLAKAAGAGIGWGIQFQQPVFLVFMTGVLALFAANLAGLFEIDLPHRLSALAGGVGGGSGLAGHFGTGAVATLLATPCSAPFVGTAVAFALARGPAEILTVFSALGVGLALPYLAVAAVPRVARLLPRPGRWMVALRRVLAVALLGTALWLLSILAAQSGAAVAAGVAGLVLAAAALLALRGRLDTRPHRRALGGMAAVLGAAAFVLPGLTVAPPPVEQATDGMWRTFDRATVAAEIEAGRTVLVDVTADWCLTCQVNKAVVLDSGEVGEVVARGDVTALRADWTRPDPVISAYLAEHGRYGIPFNVVYGPAAPGGIVLPELLTEGSVMAALARAKGG